MFCSRRPRAAALALAALVAQGAAAADTTPLRIGSHAFQVEIADTAAERAHGLMGRTRLSADGGMLFVFEQADRHCFWMRDTPLALSIAFINENGRVVALADMAPLRETLHCPPSAIRYALEANQGAFAKRGIKAGAQVGGLPR